MSTSGLRLCLLQLDVPPPAQASAALFSALRRTAVAAGYGVVHAAANANGIRVLSVEGDVQSAAPEPLAQRLVGPEATHAAYRVLEWLRAERFDLVCAPARSGLPFYAVTARHQGRALQGTRFCTIADGLTLLSRHLAAETPRGADDLVQDAMERRTLTLSDRTWVLDPAIEDWSCRNAWTIPGLRSGLAKAGLEALAREILADVLAGPPVIQTATGATLADAMPLVSVCIPHFNRPALLRQAIESVRRQTYPNIEIVVVDDASTDPDAQAALRALDSDLAGQGGRLVRHESNRYLGAARNTAAQHARGDFLLFLDDDDYAKPDQAAALVQVALATGADIINSLCDRLTGDLPPRPGQEAEERWLTLGNAPAVGVFQNLFGTASALFRKASFQRLGGFSEIRGVGCEDWEIFARASLAGMNLQTVPEALYWYRLTRGSMLQTGSAYAGEERALTPYFTHVPQSLWPVLRFAHGADPQLRSLERELRHREAVLRHRDALITHREAHIVHLTQVNRDPAEQIAELSRHLAEMRAACHIMLGGYGSTPQSAVDAVLQSGSWRLARLLQAPFRYLAGRREDAPPRVADWVQAATVISTLRQSSSWELTGVLRALGRLIRRR